MQKLIAKRTSIVNAIIKTFDQVCKNNELLLIRSLKFLLKHRLKIEVSISAYLNKFIVGRSLTVKLISCYRVFDFSMKHKIYLLKATAYVTFKKSDFLDL